MPDFGIFRGFNEKLFGDKLYAGQLPTQLGLVGSENFGFIGLLDDYPNAATAYSLRQLKNAYTGSVIRVRRASDNTEQNIGFVDNELDTSSLTSFCSGTNGFVTTWYDQSGNGRNATQTTAANQPQIVNSGNIILENTKATIDFGGPSEKKFLEISSGAFSSYNLISYFHVARINSFLNSNAGIFGPRNSNSVGIEVLQHDIIGVRTLLRLNGVSKNNGSLLMQNNTQGLFSFISNQTNTKAYNNNNNVTLINNTPMGNLTYTNVYSIGCYSSPNEAMSGNMQELIIYQIDQTNNINEISNLINEKYNIY
jgi:hypothetical protein